jgi:hypothetical protein
MMVIIGAPSLIAAVTQEKDRRLAWGTFMPGGIALATWLAPSVMAHAGWRGLWAWFRGASGRRQRLGRARE